MVSSITSSKHFKQMNNFTIYNTPKPFVLYFEHNTLGEDCAGHMWFDENKTLIDYDGVFELPQAVIQLMLDKGCDMSYATDILDNNELPHSTGVKNV
jgi:hypothetical protein